LIRISQATCPVPGGVNEDCVLSGPDWAFVLDGATAPQGVDSGCVHTVAWLVHRLAGALGSRLARGSSDAVADVLADAIREVCAAHADTCDLSNPDSPSSTVAIVRRREDSLDCLVLADSPIAVRGRDGTITVIEDDRLAHLPGGPPYSFDLVRRTRNHPGGFWVASTVPAAAHEAVTATFEVADLADVGIFSDGVARLVDWYGYDWPRLFAVLGDGGPGQVIDLVREAERRDPRSRRKPHDDATAVLMTMAQERS
jgi:Protein phosphatase 2C